jgi:hypothetical protein
MSSKAASHRPAESPDRPISLVDAFCEAQRTQCEALLSWQESLATFGKDFWGQWAVRYSGGLPFDC